MVLVPVTSGGQPDAMEGMVLTLVLVVAMVLTVVLLGRSRPRSSQIGGYRAT